MSKPIVGLQLALAAALGLAVYGFNRGDNHPRPAGAHSEPRPTTPVSRTNTRQRRPAPSPMPSPPDRPAAAGGTASPPSSEPLTFAQRASHKINQLYGSYENWQREYVAYLYRVGWDVEQKKYYAAYSREALEALADTGDVYALQQLTWELLRDDKNFAQGRALALQAAARGSVDALSALASHYYNPNDPAATRHFRATHPEFAHLPARELRRAMQRQKAALQILKGMRGNVEQASYALQRYTKGRPPLSEADLQRAKSEAEKMYADLEATRLQWGLPRFENTNPHTAVVEGSGAIPPAIAALFRNADSAP